MKIEQKTLEIKTRERFEFVDITPDLTKIVRSSSIEDGFVLVRSRHTTGAITCTESDQTIHRDARRLIEKLMPIDFGYEHNYEGEINGRAHQAVMLGFGHSTWAPIMKGDINLGTWQRMYFVELFQPMRRSIDVVMVGQ